MAQDSRLGRGRATDEEAASMTAQSTFGHLRRNCHLLSGSAAVAAPAQLSTGLAGRLNCASSWCDLSRTPLRKNTFGPPQSGKLATRMNRQGR
jgi:hypothetical protein